MHQELKISPDETVYYRYNPDVDVLAVRLRPEFGPPAAESPVPELPQVTISRDAAGQVLGLRVAGVQQMILQALVRDVFEQLRPQLLGAAASPAAAAAATSVATPSRTAAPDRSPGVDAEPVEPRMAQGPASPPPDAPTAPAVEARSEPEADASGPRKRRRRRRRSSAAVAAGASAGPSEDDEAWDAPEPPPAETPDKAGGEPAGLAGASELERELEGPESVHEVEDPEPVRELGGSEPVHEVEGPEPVRELGGPEPVHVVEAPDAFEAGGDAGFDANVESGGEADARSDAASAAAPEDAELSPAFQALGMDPRLGRAVAALGFSEPTPIQVEAIPPALAGRDVVGLAQTGTGKTLAFAVAGLHQLLAEPDPAHPPRMLVLTPTRELTVQVAAAIEDLVGFTDLRVTTIYGGVGMGPQIQALRRGVDVVVATPGRMLDHLRRGNARLDRVRVLVLDEADRMLDMGFLPDVRSLLRQLPAARQTMLFTATMPGEIESLSREFQREPLVVEIARRMPPAALEQALYPVGKHLKVPLLLHLLDHDPAMSTVLVFTERKVDADILARRLRVSGVKVALMHGDRRQVDRERALVSLKSGAARVLVATNVAARGLDIEEISHVVNYDVPQTVDEYVHRVGRTARATAGGTAYTFVTLGDEPMITRIESVLGRQLPRVQAEGFDYEVPPPSWAKPSAREVMAMLDRQTTLVDRLKHLGRR